MKKNNKKGFTLAELLIVVAIIAVLVAIAIPVFTTQLEKSREATDLANIRSAYAEAMASAIAGDTSATAPDGVSVSGSTYSVTTVPAQSTGAFDRADTTAIEEYLTLPASVTKGNEFTVTCTLADDGSVTATAAQ